MLPANVSIHKMKIDASDRVWFVAVADVMEDQNGGNLLLKLTLERNIDEEVPVSRELSLVAPAAVILETETSSEVADRIRSWIETTEGDGFLDLRI